MLWTILIGFVVGVLARAIKPGEQAMGWILTTFIGQGLGWYAYGARAGFLASIGGAILLLVIYEAIKPRLARKKEEG